jgi:hypothetical protein
MWGDGSSTDIVAAAVVGESMNVGRASKRTAAYRALAVGGAIGLPVLLYVAGFPTLGGVLLLSSVLVFVVAAIKFGVLSTAWVQRESPRTIRSAALFELAKAFVCAGLAVDALFGGIRAMESYRLVNHDVTIILLLTVTGLLVIGAGLFLTRWFAGYLLSRR